MMNYSLIHEVCHSVAIEAGIKSKTSAMIVGSPTTPLGSDIDYTKKTYMLDDGPCGYAWVTIRPGNSKLANAYKRMGLARKAWNGGVDFWVSEFGQSVQRKEAYASAYAAKLRELTGHDNIYAGSRLD